MLTRGSYIKDTRDHKTLTIAWSNYSQPERMSLWPMSYLTWPRLIYLWPSSDWSWNHDIWQSTTSQKLGPYCRTLVIIYRIRIGRDAISTNPKPTIYRNVFENTGELLCIIWISNFVFVARFEWIFLFTHIKPGIISNLRGYEPAVFNLRVYIAYILYINLSANAGKV